MKASTLGALAGCLLVAGCAATPAGRTAEEPAATASVPAGDDSVLGLGDSVMSGTHCGCAGIVARYVATEQPHSKRRLVAVNLGVDGSTTSTLRADLGTSAVQRQVARARVVLVIIGANDLVPELRRWQASSCPRSCYGPAVDAMGRRLADVLADVRSARRSRPGPVLVLDYWNVFPDGDQTRQTQGQSAVSWARGVSRVANRTICRTSTSYGDRCVDLYQPMLTDHGDPTDLLAADGDHPNTRGVALIVRQLVAATPADAFAG